MRKIFILILLLVVGCATKATPTPITGYRYLLGNDFWVFNDNPMLEGYLVDVAEDGTVRYRPEKHSIYSEARTIEGYEDQYSGHASISYNNGYVFDISSINGEWGFRLPTQIISVGCVIMKMVGESDINPDLEVGNSYTVNMYVSLPGASDMILVGTQPLPIDRKFELISILQVNSVLALSPTYTIQASWGSTLLDSSVRIDELYIAQAPSGFCNGEVLELG